MDHRLLRRSKFGGGLAAVVEALPKPGKPRVRATAEPFRAILREHGYREPGLEYISKRMPRSGYEA